MSGPGNVGFSGRLRMKHTGVRCVTQRRVAAVLVVLAVVAPVVQAFVAPGFWIGIGIGIAVNLVAFGVGFWAIKRATFVKEYEA